MFKSVFIDGKIVSPVTKEEISLRFNSGAKDALPYLTAVTIDAKYGVDITASLTLSPPYEEALKLISKNQKWLRIGNTVALRWGYADVPGSMSDWFIGWMALPIPSFSEEISIEIPIKTNFSINKLVSQRAYTSIDSPDTFENIAIVIARKYGKTVEFINLNPKQEKALRKIKHPALVQSIKTDLQFLMSFVETYGVTIVIRGSRLIFVPKSKSATEFEYAVAFQMYGRIDIENNIYPLDGFEPESMGTLLLDGKNGMMGFPSNPNADPKKPVEKIVSKDLPSDKKISGNASINVPGIEILDLGLKNSDNTDDKTKIQVPAKEENDECGRRIPLLVVSQDGYDEFCSSVLDGARENDAADQLRVTIRSMALPWLASGMLIKLIGVGDFFSTIYRLNDISISITESGAESTMVIGPDTLAGLEPDGLDGICAQGNDEFHVESGNSVGDRIVPEKADNA